MSPSFGLYIVISTCDIASQKYVCLLFFQLLMRRWLRRYRTAQYPCRALLPRNPARTPAGWFSTTWLQDRLQLPILHVGLSAGSWGNTCNRNYTDKLLGTSKWDSKNKIYIKRNLVEEAFGECWNKEMHEDLKMPLGSLRFNYNIH